MLRNQLDYEQDAREEALRDFRSGKTRIMVATDVMSRGIDIKGIDLVINYDVPGDAEDYVHRIGRTARAKTEGMAVTLVCPDDMFKFSKIERLIDRELYKEQPQNILVKVHNGKVRVVRVKAAKVQTHEINARIKFA